MKLGRRDFLKKAAISAAMLGLPRSIFSSATRVLPTDPHFFIHVFMPGGVDQSYLFDARPAEMSTFRNPWIQNYGVGEERDPVRWEGRNGQSAWVASYAQPLLRFFQEKPLFSVLNGILMSDSIDGHSQVKHLSLSNSINGGRLYDPDLGLMGEATSFSTLVLGSSIRSAKNGNRLLNLYPKSYRTFVERFQAQPYATSIPGVREYLREIYRFEAQAGEGAFSEGASALLQGLAESPQFVSRVRNLDAFSPVADATTDPSRWMAECLSIAHGFFKCGLSQSVMIFIPESEKLGFDVHDAPAARKMPAKARALVDVLATFFKYLDETPWDGTRRLSDVCSFLFHSEFGRSMRNSNQIDQTGTNHNTFANQALIGGRGFKRGCIFGETDFRCSEDRARLSGAHLQRDPGAFRVFGKPFDVKTGQVSQEKPTEFRPNDYFTWPSLINTIQHAFQVPASLNWKREFFEANPAPIIPNLLQS